MAEISGQIRQVADQLTIVQRLWIAGAAVASAVVLFAFVTFAGQPDYQAAFTRLSPASAGAISDSLRTAKIPFQMADAGATILVPASQLSAARVAAGAAASSGTDTQGFDLFNNTGFGMSEFDQQVTYQRALQGELTQTIQAMDGVDTARVAIVPAKKGLFASDDQPASASVMVQMQNGGTPTAAMVRGITTTVSSAVAGLTPDNVTVVDNTGRVLAGPENAVSADAVTAQLQIERDTEEKVAQLLDQALGPGHAAVSVSAVMDFDKVEQDVTTYTPVNVDQWTPVSVQRTTETYSGSAGSTAAGGGIPGANSNVPGLVTYPGTATPTPGASAAPSGSPAASASPGTSASPAPSASPAASARPSASPKASGAASPAASPAGSPGYLKTEETVNYNLSQTVQHIVRQPGSVKRLSIAVLVDQSATGALTPDALTKAISAAIGADPTRGDVISVNTVAFASASPKAAAAGSSAIIGQAGTIVPTAIAVLLGLLLLFIFWRNTRALRRRADEVALLASGEIAGQLGPGAAAQLLGAMPSAPELPENTPSAQVQYQLRTVADQKPDALVGLMNQWLTDTNGKRR